MHSEINIRQIDNDKDIHVVMPMYNLIEHSDNYSKTSRGLWQCYKDESALADGVIADFPANNNNNSALLKFKQKITGKTENDGTKNVEIIVPLKC